MQTYKVIGIMSGTSIDGIDIAFCEFHLQNDKWEFEIIEATTYPYEDVWKNNLVLLYKKDPTQLNSDHKEYGHYTGQLVNRFLNYKTFKPDFIASHGHTIFHQPEKKITIQLGDGKVIAKTTGLPVVFDFRSMDVELGGQGAPLVPIGDKLLFSDYNFCLNLGGFSNISYDYDGKRIAFDICPVNFALNYLSGKAGLAYDEDGKLASQGNVDMELLSDLNRLKFYTLPPPKSLGREWFEKEFQFILDKSSVRLEDKLRTLTEHIAQQVSNATGFLQGGKILVTGGGARNSFLIESMRTINTNQVVVPHNDLVDFKEAMIFAFLGVLKWRNEINCLSSVTGAETDSSGGVIAYP